MESFDVDDYEHSSHDLPPLRPSFKDRLLHFLPFSAASRKGYSLDVGSGIRNAAATTTRPRTARGLIRTLFNYPDADMKLRGTAWLDGLRGLAAFEVFIFHYNHDWVDEGLSWGSDEFSDPAWWRAPIVRTIYGSGSAAVCVFFAISGYVLSHRILGLYRQQRHEEAYSALSSAVFRRAIRLYLPVFLLSGFLMLLCSISDKIPKATPYEPQATFLLEVAHWVTTMVHMIVPLRYPDRWDYLIDQYGGGVSWTIPLEYYGSIVVFIALLFVSRTRSLATRLGLILLMVAHSFIKDDWMAGQFLLGMAFADYQLGPTRPKTPSASTIRRTVVAISNWSLFAFGFYLSGIPGFHAKPLPPTADPSKPALPTDPFPVMPRPGFDWIAQPLADLGLYRDRAADRYLECLAGMCTIVGIGHTRPLQRLLELRPVQYLGRVSFGLYLCHVPLRAWLRTLDPLYLRLFHEDPDVPLAQREENWAYFAAYVCRMVPIILVNLVVAGLFERFVDRPSVALGKNLELWCLKWTSRDDGSPGGPEYVPLARTESLPLESLDADGRRGVMVGDVAAQEVGVVPVAAKATAVKTSGRESLHLR
jgi:peptidoglycan/LPS O-acetylase OafA/YrhL